MNKFNSIDYCIFNMHNVVCLAHTAFFFTGFNIIIFHILQKFKRVRTCNFEQTNGLNVSSKSDFIIVYHIIITIFHISTSLISFPSLNFKSFIFHIQLTTCSNIYQSNRFKENFYSNNYESIVSIIHNYLEWILFKIFQQIFL